MRVRIVLKTDEMPLLYRHRIISLIKEALMRSDKDYKEFLYDGKITKPFTFSLMFPRTKEFVNKKVIINRNFEIEDKVALIKDGFVSLFISSSDYRFMISLFTGLKKIGSFDFSYGDCMLVDGKSINLEVKSISVLNEKVINNNFAVFKTMSPIVLEDKDDKPIIFLDDNFEKELNEIMDRILRSQIIRGFGLKRHLEFEPIKMSKQVIKHTLKDFREKTGKPIMYITGNTGIFKLSGDAEDLNMLYKIGIGNRTGQGFGMLEILK
ncbi:MULTISPECIES: CRISPR-associated endoribonuclease Cas6 [unclassified Hydrogenobaculum]|uniref:CRISPR-associated endoribonuclease Cas6 n=1 Tax=unclassified Hydrogenobaculum TaxID=2622382 RepID=UPI0001C52ACA|nr:MULTISPECIES: CRISPR-associated endoribonuclease Cas6 [unclassified Hydrogenobaculum]AEF19059.1 CRISPR-associated protein Cas6 [Hydrogenobaculum sp. 3684]AEG46348.1 CRISPR-associated protein Cas6 [Hydrogenobaculum sp. SHO]AGG14992.1 CRISPR-associated protein Cas6 [Hydrogenobaculum sp. HO]AGH93289.1 CRISPR-associated endoribonuclease Cas6 [Hydrogenobaculum sp. SN]